MSEWKSNKPLIRKSADDWYCIVPGDVRSRMGRGPTPAAAYRSWELWSSSMGESTARAIDAARLADLAAWIAKDSNDHP
jgi:hypothetical protein